MSNRAWVTLATNDSYGLGALVLAHSLRRVESAYPSVVLITPSVTEPMRERLRAVFAEVIIVDVLDSRDAAHLALLQRPELGITFTKIHCWSLTQYEKCVFLDADTLVVQNCDELFEREQLSAAPDVGWPDCFNSGVFVYTPSAETFSQLITFAQERGSFDGGDQGLLNSFFSDWAHGDINKHLPFLYNVTSAAFYSYLPALKHFGQNLKIIHFIGAAKPWLQHFNFESHTVDAPEHIRGLLQLWWDLFASQVHSQLDTGMVEVEEPPDVPAIPPHDVSHQYHYQPTLDPESEFAWHHPDAQKGEESQETQIDITKFHDPWQIYKGYIPANTEHEASPQPELGRVENQDEIRKYVWNYQAQEYNQYHDTQHSEHEWHHSPPAHEQHWHQHHSHTAQHSHEHHSHTHHHHDSSSHTHHHESYYFPNDEKFHEHTDHNYNNHSTHDNVSAHHVQADTTKKRNRRRRRLNRIDVCVHEGGMINGDLSGSESDDYEEIMPRHPYDGYYLRHRVTIDARGRKVCSHEVPPTPSPSPPPDSPSLIHDLSHFAEDEYLSTNNNSAQSGVAGNLARVLPGGAGQREALDELTRRQGWEAGNIDYMGADSFDNIWAKISQTLSKPRSSPPKQSPPKEIAPPQPAPEQTQVQSGEVAKEPVIEQVEVAKEAAPAEAVAPQEPAAAPAEAPAPVEEAAPADVPVTVEAVAAPEAPAPVPEVPVPVEAVAPVEAAAPAVVSEPVVAVPPSEVPVTVEAVEAEIPATVEAVAEVTSAVPAEAPAATEEIKADPVKVVEQPEQKTETPVTTEAPAAAVQEPAAEAPKVVEPSSAAAAPAATPEKPAEASATDSPPLAHTPSKEEAAAPAAKSEERRKPAGKLKLVPPAAADPLPTPDSELEDAAALAQSIIASELRTPTVTPPEPAAPATPASPPPAAPAPAPQHTLGVEEPEVPTPPVGAVSLAQIGVKSSAKGKSTTAEQIESSVSEPVAAAAEAPKKKLVKKVVKKDAGAAGADAPVPPPRKKEKKPKEK
ncbi:uncharacterized protein LOC142972359 isoform X2 [Anticarsia gemmatalis]|uniref:uncharacterized protein LOC142972359 isoform X2 n=1 Tax=Anticarsia gemmatalis TaxID=129554 RepID=UPI003F76EA66